MPELVISWVVVGAVAGLMVYLFSSRRLRGGLFGNLLVGIVGACAGGYLVTYATHVDIGRSTLTWGILVTSALSAGVIATIAQAQAKERTKP